MNNWRDEIILYITGRLPEDPLFRDQNLSVFFHVRLADLTSPSGQAPDGERNSQLFYSFLICQGTDVLLSGGLEDSQEKSVRFSFRIRSIPYLALQSPTEKLLAKIQEALMTWRSGEPQDHWRYDWMDIPRSEWPALAAKRMMEWDERFQPVCLPSRYGQDQGLGEHFACQESGSPVYAPCCTRERWKQLQTPPDNGPEWQMLSLERRLERLGQGLAGNPGHYTASLLRLMDMPLEVYMDGDTAGMETLREELGEEPLTYGQAALRIDELLRSDLQLGEGRRAMWALARQMVMSCRLRKKREQQEAEKKTTGGRWGWNSNR